MSSHPGPSVHGPLDKACEQMGGRKKLGDSTRRQHVCSSPSVAGVSPLQGGKGESQREPKPHPHGKQKTRHRGGRLGGTSLHQKKTAVFGGGRKQDLRGRPIEPPRRRSARPEAKPSYTKGAETSRRRQRPARSAALVCAHAYAAMSAMPNPRLGTMVALKSACVEHWRAEGQMLASGLSTALWRAIGGSTGNGPGSPERGGRSELRSQAGDPCSDLGENWCATGGGVRKEVEFGGAGLLRGTQLRADPGPWRA